MTSFGRITPFIAHARFTTLLLLLQDLLRYPPSVVSFPLLAVITTLQSLLEAYVPPARRKEEAATVSMALSPREQWSVYQLLYPMVCEVGLGSRYQIDTHSTDHTIAKFHSDRHSIIDSMSPTFLHSMLQRSRYLYLDRCSRSYSVVLSSLHNL